MFRLTDPRRALTCPSACFGAAYSSPASAPAPDAPMISKLISCSKNAQSAPAEKCSSGTPPPTSTAIRDGADHQPVPPAVLPAAPSGVPGLYASAAACVASSAAGLAASSVLGLVTYRSAN